MTFLPENAFEIKHKKSSVILIVQGRERDDWVNDINNAIATSLDIVKIHQEVSPRSSDSEIKAELSQQLSESEEAMKELFVDGNARQLLQFLFQHLFMSLIQCLPTLMRPFQIW